MGRLIQIVVGAVAVTALTAPGAAYAQTTDYIVRPGDTCAGIAARHYGDSRLVDLIHDGNPGMGPSPHALAPGRVLHLPPKPAPGTASPDAKLSFVRNRVDVSAGETKPGRPNDPLYRGNRVATRESSEAGITFRDESQVRVEEQTLVIILGDVNAASAKRRLTASDATLVNGSLRARLAEIGGRSSGHVIETQAARVEVGSGEVRVSVDEQKTTRLAVHRGQSNINAQKKTVSVVSGFGSRADDGRPPTPPKPLPPPPAWEGHVPPLLVLSSEPATETLLHYRMEEPLAALASWHVQIARDPEFTEVVIDTKAPAAVTTISLRPLGAGQLFFRVSATDTDHFEGRYSPVLTTTVAKIVATVVDRRTTRVEIEPAGLPCALDARTPAPVAGPLVVPSGSARFVSCSLGEGATVRALAVPVGRWSPSIRAPQARSISAEYTDIQFAMVDGDGHPIEEDPVLEVSPSSAQVAALRRTGAGLFIASIRHPASARAFRLSARVTTGEVAIADEVTIPRVEAPPPAPAVAPAVRTKSVGFAAGYGFAGGTFSVGGPHLALDGGMRVGRGPQHLVVGLGASLDRAASDSAVGRATAWTLGGGPTGSLFVNDGRVAPYLSLGLGLLYQRTASTRGVDGSALLGGVMLALGSEVRLGPGALFGEVAYRTSLELSSTGDPSLSQRGAVGVLGSRFRF